MTASNISILVVDDSLDTLEMISRKLQRKGYNVFTSSGVSDALAFLEKNNISLVITDYKMPKISGLELIRHINENYKQIKVIMITGYPTIDGAVEAVKTGAEEYLTKPFTDDELYKAVEKTVKKIKTEKLSNRDLKTDSFQTYGMIGNSTPMKGVFHSIEKAIAISATVLISGESGTGKELVARAIHYNSVRSSAPFVPVNCSAIADGGTIFLDEIGETSLSMQVKLLRVLQDKQICMVGAKHTRSVDVRIIAATNKSLINLVEQGHFREDLFYRLNVITIDLPALRERGEDIILLTNFFVDKFSKEIGKPKPEFTENALNAFKNYSWPGNIRELENTIQRLIFMSDHKTIDTSDLPEGMRYTIQRDKGLDRTLQEMEVEYIRNVLASVQGNKSQAAQILGIDRKTLRNKLKTED